MTQKVNICGVPYEMSIVDGSVLFSNKSGFWGVSGRFFFIRESMLWYLDTNASTFNKVAACHLSKMVELLETHIGGDHETEQSGGVFELKFREIDSPQDESQ